MESIEYSIDALNVKSAFYGARAMVYVEGDDDVLFWQKILAKTTGINFEIESVGGCGEIDKYITKIESGQLNSLVARDSDLIPLTINKSFNPKVLYTQGYSIENTMYSAETLHQLATVWCKSNKVTVIDCQAWLDELAKAFAPLLHLDIANAMSNEDTKTIGDNCTRFMKSQSSEVPCSTKVASYASEIQKLFSSQSISNAKIAIGTDTNRIILFLRGHFLVSAVIKFLVNKAKAFGKKVTISADSLYAAALLHFGGSFGPTHPHYLHYSKSSDAAVLAL
ncbi:MAG TPA: DUF4435 domain-containing protein [Rhodoferax sp.]